MPSNVITEVKATVEKRMEELRPAYLEYLELEAYVELTGNFQPPTPEAPQAETPAPAPAATPAKPAATRPRPGSGKKPAAKKQAAKKPAAAKAKPAAPNDGETVAKVKEIVAAHPDGIKIGDIIKEGNLSQSYTYDVVKRLTESRELVKRNRKIYIHENSATTAPKASQAQPQVAA